MELVFTDSLKNEPIEAIFYPTLAKDEAILSLLKNIRQDNKAVLQRLKRQNFRGKKGQIFTIYHEHKAYILLGTGQEKKLLPEDWRETAASLINYLKKYSAPNIGLVISAWLKGSQDVELLAQMLAEGINLANYDFIKYKKIDKEYPQAKVQQLFLELPSSKKIIFKKGWEYGQLLASGTILARDLVNEPASQLTPNFLAETAKAIAKNNKNIRVRILEKDQVAKLGMGAFVGVDQGSSQPLKFIHLVYKPSGRVKQQVALVGKGITFDSGGLNIKTGDSMAQMKIDMAGAATVLGVFSVLNKLNFKVEVQGFIAACENMPSGEALKPGDIVKNLQGKTIEIANTDAEGRVTLADSLAYAQKFGLKTVVDIATLTGAIMQALGPNYAGLFSNDEKLARDFLKAADMSGEKFWPMPLALEYKDFNKSQVADVRNIPITRYGGAISAALFLQEFINPGVFWSHLDIAAPAYAEKPMAAYIPTGGVGFGVRTILEWLKYI